MSAILEALRTLISTHKNDIEAWFEAQYISTRPLFYSSVDLRHSGSKLAPVDTNLFPGGFNNLNPEAQTRAAKAMQVLLDRRYPGSQNILLIPESHTRNTHYLDNVAVLQRLLEKTGRKVMLGDTALQAKMPHSVVSASGVSLTIHPLHRQGQNIALEDGFVPDLIILNNDLTTGVPELLKDVIQPIIPRMESGWHMRRKSSHFQSYNSVVRNFTEHFPFDGWLISTLFHQCGEIDFKSRSGIECVAIKVEQVLHSLREKYAEHDIKDAPYVFIKADMGTYGMGIMTASSGEELFSMNKDIRKKMGVVKGGMVNTEVIIQEGIPTIDTVKGKAAEPFLYLVGRDPVGCIYRVNEGRGSLGNLNSPGMTFEQADCAEDSTPNPCKFSPHGLIASLASLAAAKEG